MPEAAVVQDTQAPGSNPVNSPPIHDRIKAFLTPQPAEEPTTEEAEETADAAVEGDDAETVAESKASVKPKKVAEVEAEVEETEADVPGDDAQTEETHLSTVNDLAEATGLDLDKIMDLEFPTKIDGKDGKARLRDLVRSYQLDGHINQKLATFDNDRKAFGAERDRANHETADRLLKLDAGAKTLERALMGEFANVDWQKLQAEDPLQFNANYVAYQQRYAVLQDIAQQVAAEQQQARAQHEQHARAWADEQKQLFTAKIPEWADDTRRNKDKAEILEYLKGYGFSKEEFESVTDHRQALIIRDAWKWNQLQKSKPATLNKVKAAPKLLKPGTKQSRTVTDNLASTKDRDRLRGSGRVRDAKPVLKRLLFG